MISPVAKFHQYWRIAKEQGDISARYCTLATVDDKGQCSMRTLVLREVTADSFIIFINNTSPKWQDISNGQDIELLCFWPSLMRQHRIRGKCTIMCERTMKAHWARKPYESKLLDYFYQTHPQSTEINSREELIEGINRLKESFPVADDIPYMDNAKGVAIAADYIEFWHSSEQDNVHDRSLYTKTESGWQRQILVP